MNSRRVVHCFVGLAMIIAPARGQTPRFMPGRVVVLVEPNAVVLPPGLTRAPASQASVAVPRLRALFDGLNVREVRQGAPHWPDVLRQNPRAKVFARRKGQFIPPDALTDFSWLYILALPESADVRAAATALAAADGVVWAEPDYLIHSLAVRAEPRGSDPAALDLQPNDPRFVSGQNWGFNGAWGVNAPAAWQLQTGRASAKISLFDTGIDHTHPDFAGKVAGEYDFVHSDGDAYPDGGQSDPSHGLSTAGVAAAKTNDAFGSAGLCGGFGPSSTGCPILAAKILGDLSIWQSFTEWLGTTSMVADAVSWASANGAKVLNNSWCNSELNHNEHEAFRNAYLLQMVVTAAMGNTQGLCGQNQPTDQVVPAAWADVLMAVGATNELGDRITKAAGYNWESGTGPHISVVAPGVNHYSDVLGGTTAPFGGTSEATPFVSGLAGLLWSEAEAKSDSFNAWDVRQLIQSTARPPHNTAPGWNDQTGWGIVNAAAALQALQPPNDLAFVTLAPTAANCYSQVGPTNWTFLHSFVVLTATRCEIRRTITFAKRYTAPPIVWGRPVSGGGVTPSNPNSEIYWTGVVPGTATSTGVTLRTYVYWVADQGGYWWPAAPNQVGMAYAVVGQVAPFVVTADAPGLVTAKSTYSLTGSASDPASGWLWEQSQDGGPWGWWSNNQSTQFVAYAGTYTLDWRLSAHRNSDGSPDTGFATTRVCIPYSPSTCEAAAPAPAPVISATRPNMRAPSGLSPSAQPPSGLHFGSGLWIGPRALQGNAAVRFYSFEGAHDQTSGLREWPNMLERDSVTFITARNGTSPALAVTSVRVLGDDPRVRVFRIQGVGDPGNMTRRMEVGLAADPDVGDAGKDVLGFESNLGLVWVRGGDSTYLGYIAPGAPEPVQVHQFGVGLESEPASDTGAYRLLSDTSRLGQGQPDDVRFLLVAPGIPVAADGRFAVAFATIRATSLDSLRVLARRVADRYATVAQGNALPSAAATFGLRQARTRASLNANVAGGGGTADPRAELQQFGITALDYSVPAGQEVIVRIRIFDPSGGLVRVLMQGRVAGGDYHVEWDGRNERGVRVSPGVYVAVMEAGAFHAQRKLVITR
jgi:subtilase family protein/flagellar hook capping protein FlgD